MKIQIVSMNPDSEFGKKYFFFLQVPKLFMNEHFWWNWKTVPLHVPHQPTYLWFRALPPPKMPTESLRKKSTKRAKWLTICPLLQVCIFIYQLHLSHSYKLYLTESTKEEEEMDQFDMDIWKQIQNQSNNAKPHTQRYKKIFEKKTTKKFFHYFCLMYYYSYLSVLYTKNITKVREWFLIANTQSMQINCITKLWKTLRKNTCVLMCHHIGWIMSLEFFMKSYISV